jgi:hypothetical protein
VLEAEEVEMLLAVRLKSVHDSFMLSAYISRRRHIPSPIDVSLVINVAIFRVAEGVEPIVGS